MILRTLLLACAVVLNTACGDESAPESTGNGGEQASVRCDPDNGGLVLPRDFCAVVVADNLGVIRHLAVNGNGDIYVSMRHQRLKLGGITAMRDEDGDGRMDRFERIS
ncbi:MAG: hypothetical protein R3318_05480, partial [Gammaproteobacteria bacterium]|nr:hypothetical protein [Gammaproteobacteria bacterium]